MTQDSVSLMTTTTTTTIMHERLESMLYDDEEKDVLSGLDLDTEAVLKLVVVAVNCVLTSSHMLSDHCKFQVLTVPRVSIKCHAFIQPGKL